MNDQQLLHYFQNQQSQPGWFSLIHIMIDSMVKNVGETQSRPFLVQMGDTLGARFPLALARTVGELEAQINVQLAAFNWGYIDIEASETAMRIHHMALPVPAEEMQQTAWNSAFGAVLEGLYARWLRDQGVANLMFPFGQRHRQRRQKLISGIRTVGEVEACGSDARYWSWG